MDILHAELGGGVVLRMMAYLCIEVETRLVVPGIEWIGELK